MKPSSIRALQQVNSSQFIQGKDMLTFEEDGVLSMIEG